MTEERRFNLVDEAWIPVAGTGRASLREVFSRYWPGVPGGTPLEKIALFKLLQAIAQAAHTPADEAEWLALGPDGLAEACLAYLERWHEAFWLYGPQPFLQFPAVERAKIVPYGSLLPHIASGNTSVLFQSQVERPLDDGQKALLLLVNMSCCFSGKKVDKAVALSPGIEKSSSAKAGPAICALGLLHSFVLGPSLRETVWRNLLTRDELAEERLYENGVGTPPWERMPRGEADDVAEALKRSLMGRLVPLARFYLLTEAGMHSVEGRHGGPQRHRGPLPEKAQDALGRSGETPLAHAARAAELLAAGFDAGHALPATGLVSAAPEAGRAGGPGRAEGGGHLVRRHPPEQQCGRAVSQRSGRCGGVGDIPPADGA